jgi:hypothetical protein
MEEAKNASLAAKESSGDIGQRISVVHGLIVLLCGMIIVASRQKDDEIQLPMIFRP